ncbi:MAG: transcription antitermination factor NusB, partial [Thermodesulfobacteriota bacterium]
MGNKRGVDYPRFVALTVLNRIEGRGSYADIVLDRLFRDENALSPLDRAFITELVYGTLKWRMRIDWIISRFSSIKPSKMERNVLNILRIGVYQLLFLEKVPPSAAVNESVRLSVERKRKGFINGVLRKIEREKGTILYPDREKEPVEHIAAFYSHPPWIIERWIKRYGIEETMALCKTNNTPPPFTLRVNILKTAREKCLRFFSDRGIRAEPACFSPDGIKISKPGNIIEGLEKGLFFIQDEASQ